MTSCPFMQPMETWAPFYSATVYGKKMSKSCLLLLSNTARAVWHLPLLCHWGKYRFQELVVNATTSCVTSGSTNFAYFIWWLHTLVFLLYNLFHPRAFLKLLIYLKFYGYLTSAHPYLFKDILPLIMIPLPIFSTLVIFFFVQFHEYEITKKPLSPNMRSFVLSSTYYKTQRPTLILKLIAAKAVRIPNELYVSDT